MALGKESYRIKILNRRICMVVHQLIDRDPKPTGLTQRVRERIFKKTSNVGIFETRLHVHDYFLSIQDVL